MSRQDPGKGQDPSEWSGNIHDILQQMQRRQYVQFRDTGAWCPAVNVYESAHAYLVCVDLAGMTSDHVAVHCTDECSLVLAGNRTQPRPLDLPPDAPTSILMYEIDEGPFRRELKLPQPIDIEQVTARYEKGYLWITLPRISN
jgi:HSP20 family protein